MDFRGLLHGVRRNEGDEGKALGGCEIRGRFYEGNCALYLYGLCVG